MLKLLVILFIIKLYARINIYKQKNFMLTVLQCQTSRCGWKSNIEFMFASVSLG